MAPLVDDPDVVMIFAGAFMLCGPIAYFIFVYKSFKFPGVDLVTAFLQKVFNVAPTDWKDEM